MYPKNTPELSDDSAGQHISIDTAQSRQMPRGSRRELGRLVRRA